MTATRRHGMLISLLLVAVALTMGCNPFSLPFFLLAPESKFEPKIKKLASDDKNKEVSVVVLTYAGLETRPELLRADRDLSNLVVKKLREAFDYNKEKVKVVSPNKVEEFKNNHPNWRSMELAEIGRHFEADYVIYLEIDKLSLYEQGSANLLYRGRAEVTVNLVDVSQPDEGPDSRQLTVSHPNESSGGAVPVEDKPLPVFRTEFFGKIAAQVAWHFTSHPTSDDFHLD